MNAIQTPQLIELVTFSDQRGLVRHYGSHALDGIKRIYFVEPNMESGFRGWHGHKLESKVFRAIRGSFRVSSARVVDWEGREEQAVATTWTLSANSGDMLIVPAGFANGIEPLEADGLLMVMSNRSLTQSEKDDFRFSERTFVRISDLHKK